MPYPTTIILLAVIGSITVLGWQGTADGQAVVAILSGVVGAVTVGHYTGKAANGGHAPTVTTTTEAGVTKTTTEPTAPANKEQL